MEQSLIEIKTRILIQEITLKPPLLHGGPIQCNVSAKLAPGGRVETSLPSIYFGFIIPTSDLDSLVQIIQSKVEDKTKEAYG